MATGWYEQRILTALRTLPEGILQMRLGTMADRHIAIALESPVGEGREALIRALPAAKGSRVRQEREYLGRLFVSPAHRQKMAERLADALEGQSGPRGGTWIAPPDRRKNGR